MQNCFPIAAHEIIAAVCSSAASTSQTQAKTACKLCQPLLLDSGPVFHFNILSKWMTIWKLT